MVVIQGSGSLAAFLAALFLIEKVGLADFGRISTIYAAFSLLASLCSLGLPEDLQAKYAVTPQQQTIVVPIFGYLLLLGAAIVIMVTGTSLGDTFNGKWYQVIFFNVAIVCFIGTEVVCRIGFQNGKIILPQLILSFQAAMVWGWVSIEAYFTGAAEIFAPFIVVYALFFLFSYFALRRDITKITVGWQFFSSKGLGQRAFLARLLIHSYDAIPLIALQLSGYAAFSGVLAFFSRFFGPLGIVCSSLVMHYQSLTFAMIDKIKISLMPMKVLLLVMTMFGFSFALIATQFASQSLKAQLPLEFLEQFIVFIAISLYRSLFVSYQFIVQVYLQVISIKAFIITILLVLVALLLVMINLLSLELNELIYALLLLMSAAVIVCILDLKKQGFK
jgi:hypothetical protein